VKRPFKKFPLYLILLAIYSPLSLLASNYREINPEHVIRPTIASILFTIGIYYFLAFFIKDNRQTPPNETGKPYRADHSTQQVGLLTIVVHLLVLNYGRAYILLTTQLSWSSSLGTKIHLILGPLTLLLAWGGKKIIDRLSAIDPASIYAVSLTLLLLPSFNIGRISLQDQKTFEPKKLEIPAIPPDHPLPDVYHIVLDAYSREDYLSELGYDNSEFLSFLRETGFYVADCSKSNYSRTALSLSSTLNLEYLWQIFPEKAPLERDDAAIYAALSNNLAHNAFHDLGYQFITTVNGYAWSEHTNYADVVVMPENKGLLTPYILPFERMFIENSALRVLLDFGSLNEFQDGYLLNGQPYEQVTNALEFLQEIPNISGPKYIYYHLIIPHFPYVYLPDGSIAPDLPGKQGYFRSIEFINNQLKPILSRIIQQSAPPPIIIIQGDHGYIDEKQMRFLILNALYLPGMQADLYPEISPVNLYRIIFNEYFGTHLTLLKDASIQADIGAPFRREPAQLPEYVNQCP